MKKSVHLFEDDPDLKENIAELIETNGFSVKMLNSGQLERLAPQNQNAIAICNGSTIVSPIEEFIRVLKTRFGRVVVLCMDKNDPKIHEADEKILMPFEEHDLISTLRGITPPTKNFLSKTPLKVWLNSP